MEHSVPQTSMSPRTDDKYLGLKARTGDRFVSCLLLFEIISIFLLSPFFLKTPVIVEASFCSPSYR